MEALTVLKSQHGPDPDLISQCVHCGFCLPACPTYVLWKSEMDSPRGRIYLMKMASEEGMPLSPDWVRHMDTCLGCVSCMTACPSGVDYGKLIEATRAQVERQHQRWAGERLHRRNVGEPELHTLLALPAVERERAGGMDRPAAACPQRDTELAARSAKGNGVDGRAVGGSEPRAHMRLTDLLGISDGMSR